MTFILNELSLEGQFTSSLDFLQDLKLIIQILKLTFDAKIEVFRHPNLYESKITGTAKLYDLLRDRADEIVRFKSQLADLWTDGPFVEIASGDVNTKYHFVTTGQEVTQSSLSVAHNVSANLISFLRSSYNNETIQIIKNNVESKTLKNFAMIRPLSQEFFDNDKLTAQQFCSHYFKDTKICVNNIDTRYDFKNIDNGLIGQFVNQLKLFEKMSWPEIIASDGLEYKKFHSTIKFKNLDAIPNLYKFRADQKMRCFGYRDGDVFHILGFELDHKLSDRG